MKKRRPHPRKFFPKIDTPAPAEKLGAAAGGTADAFRAGLVNAVSAIAMLAGASGARAEGSSHAFRFNTSPQFQTKQWRPQADVTITGIFVPLTQLMAITKNGMTVDGSGVIADSTGTALPEGSEVPWGQVLVAGQIPTGYSRNFNFPVKKGEIVYVTKNQANASVIMIYYDIG